MARGSIQFKKNKRDKIGGRYYVVLALGQRRKWIRVPDPNTKEHAEKILAKHLTEFHSGEYRELKRITFGDFSQIWLRDYVSDPNYCKKSTHTQYENVLRVHLVPFFGDYELVNITSDLVQSFISSQSRNGTPAKTILNRLAPLTRLFTHAVKWNYLKVSPMNQVERPRLRNVERRFLSGDQIRGFLEAVPEEWKAFFVTAAMTGMRKGELLAMRWKNLNWKQATYSVRERLYMGEFDIPKTDKSRRTVDLSPHVVEHLRKHRSEQTKTRLKLGTVYENQDLLFCQPNGRPINGEKVFRGPMAEALAIAECPEIRFHDLRHSYAALLIAEGAHPKYIQSQLGHSSISITLDVYGHLMQEVGQDMMRKVDARIFGT